MNLENKKKQVKLSVIMPVHEGEKFLDETLICILSQSFRDFELIILDNQSNDNSQKIIKSFQKNDQRVKYILDTKKRNGNDCFSELIKYATGKYLIVVNDDNFLNIDFFKKLFEKIENTQSDMVVCNGRYIDEHKNEKKQFFKKTSYFRGDPQIFKIIKFFMKGDVIPLLLPSIILKETFRNMLPYLNLSKFENDADTLMGIKILSNLKIESHDELLFFCRVYDNHTRYHDNKIPIAFFKNFIEKIKHDLNLLLHCIKEILLSKINLLNKMVLILVFPILIILKRAKNLSIKYLVKIKNLL